jgi:predicted nucleic acid-binding protein
MIFYALDANIISYFLKNDAVVIQKMHEEIEKQLTQNILKILKI